jgi:kinetochore protein Spc25, fungi type
MRPPQIDLASILAQQNPQIDLRLNAYDKSARHFLKSVTNFKNRAIAVINDRRNAQAAEMKRVTEKTQSVESDIKACKVKEIEVLKGMRHACMLSRCHPCV